VIKHTHTPKNCKSKFYNAKATALQKSITKEMTDGNLIIIKEKSMPSHTKEKRIIC